MTFLTNVQTVAGGEPTKIIEMLDKIVPKSDSSKQSSPTNGQDNVKYIILAATAALSGELLPHNSSQFRICDV